MQLLSHFLPGFLHRLPGKSLILGAGLLPLLLTSTPASATGVRLYLSSGHVGHGYHHSYRTRPGFALSYGSGSHYYGGRYHHKHYKHYKHYKPPRAYYYGKPYGYKKIYPSRSVYGYPGYGRPFSYYHDNARRYNHSYKHGYRHGYHDGRYSYRRRHKVGP